jgi:hypothetical protein
MQEMIITEWEYFKELVASKKLLLQYSELVGEYMVCGAEAGIFLWKIILGYNSPEALEFESLYKPISNAPLDKKSADNLQQVAASIFQLTDSFFVKGASTNVAPNSQGVIEFQFQDQIKLVGASLQCDIINNGDFIGASVGFYDSQTWVEVTRFVETLFIVHSPIIVESTDYAVIPAGLTIRIEFNNSSSSLSKFVCAGLKLYK